MSLLNTADFSNLLVSAVFDLLAALLGQVAPVPADDVQALELLLDRVSPIAVVLHHQGSVLLLLQQQQGLEDPVNVDLQQPVELVHLGLHLGEVKGQRACGGSGVQRNGHDAMRLQLQLLTLLPSLKTSSRDLLLVLIMMESVSP